MYITQTLPYTEYIMYTNRSDGVKATATATATLQPSNREQPVSRAVYSHTHIQFDKHCTHTHLRLHSPLDTASVSAERVLLAEAMAKQKEANGNVDSDANSSGK